MKKVWKEGLIVLALTVFSLSASAQVRGERGLQLERDIQAKILKIERKILTANIAEKRAVKMKLREALEILRGNVNPYPTLPGRDLPPRRGINLAQIVNACSGISSRYYSQQCIDVAKTKQVHPVLISACAKISSSASALSCVQNVGAYNIFDENIIHSCNKITSSYYANECVKNAGKFGTNARQVSACTDISSSNSATSCVAEAGAGRVPSRAITSCVQNNSSSYYALECVKSLKY